eukprot:CAMPEP_0178441632 /NCGR_PEP_ID=MMETSP0689_2-20121128/37588_1 /TAXON_ID=160604 /ORGANISM="Amphidinium massartii, Strain CS-259" /LENGTH=316 /DNA_ID=CAMNT_0020064831 /DNA_START=15 /DNA_END=966 /DNA_ORIENTATION=+
MQTARHHYDGHRTVCTADEKAVAARIGGHTWNIISNDEEHEIYFREARNPDHFLDKDGHGSSCWFDRKKRVQDESGEAVRAGGSAAVASTLKCPPSSGKQSERRRNQAVKQLCQLSAGPDYGLYTALLSARNLSATGVAPASARGGSARRAVEVISARPSARVVAQSEWTPRRGERPPSPERPPLEEHMFSALDQVSSESHIDTRDANFADAIHSARWGRPTQRQPPAAAAAGATTGALNRTAVQLAASLPGPRVPRQGLEAAPRAERAAEVTQNGAQERDRALKADTLYLKPLLQAGSSSVKYDIVTNQWRDFWY